MKYIPVPTDTEGVRLSPELLALAERLAENVHENWAKKRMSEGWTYGTVRNDAVLQTPCLVPYSELPEAEKTYDRMTVSETLKVLIKLGYIIEKDSGKNEV